VRVHDSFPLHEGAARELFYAELFQEGVVDVGRCDVSHVILRGILTGKISFQVLRNIIAEFRQDLSAEHVPVSLNPDLLLVLEVLEARVGVAPPLPVKVIDFDLTVRVIVNDLRVLFPVN